MDGGVENFQLAAWLDQANRFQGVHALPSFRVVQVDVLGSFDLGQRTAHLRGFHHGADGWQVNLHRLWAVKLDRKALRDTSRGTWGDSGSGSGSAAA